MTLQDLGNIGEFVGALGVIASLVYLALQIRQNTRSTRTAMYQATTRDMFEAADLMARDADLNAIWFTGIRDFDSLSREEMRRFASYMFSLLRRYDNAHHQTNAGMIDGEWWAGISETLEYTISHPGVQSWWKEGRSLFRPDFREFIDQMISGSERPGAS
jgi:hypothetical protein